MGGPQLSANICGVGLCGHALFGALTFDGGVQPGTATSMLSSSAVAQTCGLADTSAPG
jgi:hypothetical protein